MTATGVQGRRRTWRRPAFLIPAGIVVALAVMWVYAIFFAPAGNLDRMHDRAWAAQAEATCAATRVQVLALPSAHSFKDVQPKAKALSERAAVIDQATILLQRQVEQLGRTTPTDRKGQEGVALWLADWKGYLQSRRDQAARMRAGEDVPFAVAEEGGAPVTLRMDAYAEANDMNSCRTPDDIG